MLSDILSNTSSGLHLSFFSCFPLSLLRLPLSLFAISLNLLIGKVLLHIARRAGASWSLEANAVVRHVDEMGDECEERCIYLIVRLHW